jgi:acetate kinase
MRTLAVAEEAGNERARLAIDVFCHRLAKAVLSMGASLEKVDAVVFTGGIGENSATVRERTLAQLGVLGVRCDPGLNCSRGLGSEGRISAEDSAVPVFVIETNEELAIARETLKTLAWLKNRTW